MVSIKNLHIIKFLFKNKSSTIALSQIIDLSKLYLCYSVVFARHVETYGRLYICIFSFCELFLSQRFRLFGFWGPIFGDFCWQVCWGYAEGAEEQQRWITVCTNCSFNLCFAFVFALLCSFPMTPMIPFVFQHRAGADCLSQGQSLFDDILRSSSDAGGCQYIVIPMGGASMMAHKGNCNNPVHSYQIEKIK